MRKKGLKAWRRKRKQKGTKVESKLSSFRDNEKQVCHLAKDVIVNFPLV